MALEKIRPRVIDETGNYTFNNVNVTGSLTASTANLGNLVTANYVKTDNLQYANGTAYPLTAGSVSGTNTQVQFNDDNALGAKSTFTFNKATDTLVVTNITANGAGLTSITGGNVTGTVANATYSTTAGTATSATTAGTVTANAQPNITSTGTLTSLTITDNGNITMSGTASQISGVNTVRANYFVGNGYNLTSTAGGNVVGKVELANVAYSVAGSNVVGAVAYAATANAVAGGNVMGQVANALSAGTVYEPAQTNITSVGTLTSLSVSGNVTASYFLGNGSQLTGIVGSYSNTNVAAYLPTYTGNVNANYLFGNGSQLTGIVSTYSNSNVSAYLPTYTGNLTAGNANISGSLTANSISTLGSGGNLSGVGYAIANYFVGNAYYLTGVDLLNVGNADIANAIANGTSNINTPYANGPITVGIGGTANAVVFSNSGNFITTTGNVSASYYFGDGSQLTNINAGAVTGSYSNTNVAAYLPTYTGNITAGNINLSYTTTATANLGNAVRANYFVGNGAYLTGVDLLSVGNADIANAIANGTSNINTPYLNGPITVAIGGTANTVVFSSTGINLKYTTTATANLGNAVISNYFVGNGAYLTGVDLLTVAGADGANYISNGTSNINTPYLNGPITVGIGGTANIVVFNTTGINLKYTTTATANLGNAVRANYFVGNGAYLTGVDLLSVGNADIANAIANGTSNINTRYANGPITVGIGGVANTVVFTSTGVDVTGKVTVGSGNTNGIVLASPETGEPAETAYLNYTEVAAEMNVLELGINDQGENYYIKLNATGGVTVANTLRADNANLGNAVRANYFIGNGAYLTGVDLLSVGNADIANAIANGTSNINTPYSGGPITVGIGGTANTVVFSSTGINLKYTTTATANLGNAVRANYFVGNGAYLTGVDLLTVSGSDTANLIANGTSNINTPYNNGPITVGVGGISNTVIFTSTGINVKGYISPSTGSSSSNGIIWPANPGGGTLDVASIKYYAVSGEQTRLEINVQNDVPGGSQDDIYFTTNSYVVVNSTMEATSTSDAPFQVLGGAGVAKKLYVGGNIEAGTNYIKGNGYYLTGVDQLVAGSADVANSIANGTSNINTPYLNGPITVGIGGTANTVVFSSTGINLSYTNTATANLGNAVRANYFVGNGAYLTGVDLLTVAGADGANYISNGTSNINTPYNNGPITVGIGGTANTAIFTTSGITANTFTGNLFLSVSGTTNAAIVSANMAGSDYFRILVGGTANDGGFVEFATADNGNEPIYFRQYNVSGAVGFGTVARTLTLLDASGDTYIPGKLTTTGNIIANSGSYFVGNGYYLSGVDQLSVGNADIANSIANGTSNINTPYLNGPITVGIGGTANTVVFNNTGNYITTTGNVKASYYFGDGSQLTGISGTYSNSNVAAYLPTYTGNLVGNNLTLTGNLIVSGTTTYVNSTITDIKDPIIELGGGTNAAALTSDDNKDRGVLLHYYSGSSTVDAFMGWDDSNVEFGVGSNVSVTNEVVTWNSYGNLRANYFIGDGSQLTGISGTYSNSNVAAYLPTYAGNITAGNINLAYVTSGTANLGNAVRANYFIGNGAYLAGVDLLSVGNADGANYISNGTSNINTPYLNGPITVGIGGTSNAVVFNNTGNYITTTGNVSASYYFGDGSQLTGISGTYSNAKVAEYLPTYTGNLTAGNISVTGIVNAASFSTTGAGGNLSGANYVIANYFVGNGAYLTGVDLLSVGNADIANAIANGNSNISTPYGNGPITVSVSGTSNTVVFNNTGNYITTTGNLSASYLFGNGSQLTGIVSTYSNANVSDYLPTYTGNVAYAVTSNWANVANSVAFANITGKPTFYSNTDANALLTAYTGNITAGNINLSYTTTATANLGNTIRANYFIGNGAYLSGVDLLSVAGSDTANLIANGTSNINTPYSNGPITVGIGGTANTVVFANTGNYITTTGNLSASYLFGNGSQLTGITATAVLANGTSNINAPYLNGPITVGIGGTSNAVVFNNTGNYITTTGNVKASYYFGDGSALTGISATTAVSITNGNSNVTALANSNITVSVNGTANAIVFSNSGNYITTTGNVKAGYYFGDGSQLSGVDTSNIALRIANGTSNVNIPGVNGNITFTVGGTGNVAVVTSTGIVVTGSGSISAAGGTVTGGSLAGTIITAAQTNITSLGPLSSLTVNANATVGNLVTSGNVYANSGVVKGQYIYGDGSNLTGLGGAGYIFNGTSNVYIPASGANVYFTVGLTANVMTVANTGVNVAGYINAGSGAITTTGNLTSGNASLGNLVTANYFSGNLYGNATTAGTVTIAAQPNITSLGTLANLSVNGTANLGAVGNVTITGGASGYFLKTDGTGNLSWDAPSGGGGGGASITYTADTTPPGSANILGDQWFNTLNNVLYEYISDGTSSYWVDVSGATTTSSSPTTLNLSNIIVTGGTSGQSLVSNGSGGLSFATLTSNIYNGNSNVSVNANSNVAFSVAGIANVLIVTSTGANLLTTGSANLGNLVTANYFTGTLTTASQPNITTVGTLANLTVSGLTTYGLSADILVTKTGATGTVTHDVSAGAVFYHTSPSANFTANFTNVSTTSDRVLTMTLLISQGATPYMCTAVQIDSIAQTIKWIGGLTATGSASKLDIVSFSLVRTSGSWIVTGQSAYYG